MSKRPLNLTRLASSLLLWIVMCCATLPVAALAGPHAGGVLVLHAVEALIYTDDGSDYCGMTELPDCTAFDAEIVGTEPTVFFVLAQFPIAPELRGVTFGIFYDPSAITLLDWGNCGDFELPDQTWPDPGTGIAVTWSIKQESNPVEVYWFAAYGDETMPGSFDLVSHADQGGAFGDGSIPSVIDPIADYGRMGFNTPGYAPCAEPGEEPVVGSITVTPADAIDGVVLAPDQPSPNRFSKNTVTVLDQFGHPASGVLVEAVFSGPLVFCNGNVFSGVTDSNGEVELTFAGGGCAINRPNAVVIRCNGQQFREYRNVRSPDFDGAAGNLRVEIGDITNFSSEFLDAPPTVGHDYDNDGNVGLSDMIIFSPSWGSASHCP